MLSNKNKTDITDISEVTGKLRSYAIHLLARMYRPDARIFAFRLQKNGQTEVLQGVSRRYTATALIGLANEDEHIIAEVLGNHSLEDVCGNLIKDIDRMNELGEVALTAWASRMLRHKNSDKAIAKLQTMTSVGEQFSTVELSWALTALVVSDDEPEDKILAERLAGILMESYNTKSGIFRHGPARKGLSALSAHVSCFADFVYPIQALSYYYKAAGNQRAGEIACQCAENMCKLQGSQGQWWWHYDVRTGRIVERYPVYEVHQASMAPMALFALEKNCGKSFFAAIEKGLNWLINPPEIPGSLIDDERKIIWRKVARREPDRLVRKLQAAVSGLHPSLRIPGMDTIFPPVTIDYESRPYEMGWILHAWPESKVTKNSL